MLNQTRATKSKSGRGQHLVAHRLLAVLLLLLTLWGQSAFAGPNMLYGHYTTRPGRGVQIDWSHPLARGLVGLWLFNEGAGLRIADSTSSNVLTVTGTPTWVSTAKGFGLNFASGDSATTPNAAFGLATYTWWIIFAADHDSVGTANTRPLFQTTTGSYIFNYDHTNAGFRQACAHTDSTSTATSAQIVSINPLKANTIYSIVGTYDGVNLRCYLNGNLEATTASNPPATAAQTLDIQRSGEVMTGSLIAVAVWRIALSGPAVSQLATEPWSIALQPNVHRWGIPVTAGGGGSGGLLLRGVGR